MKVLAKISCVVLMGAVFAGCAGKNHAYIPKIPAEAQAKLLDYFEQPDNKVFIIAIDPNGDYAYGYESGAPTLKAAAKVAVEKCDASRDASGIIARPYVYALNNKVVYEDMIRAAQKGPVEDEREAQKEEFEEMQADGEVEDAPAPEAAEAAAPAEDAAAE